jgi:hypothetical protein
VDSRGRLSLRGLWRTGEAGVGANDAAELCSAWTGETPVPTLALELFFWFFRVVDYVYYAASDGED